MAKRNYTAKAKAGERVLMVTQTVLGASGRSDDVLYEVGDTFPVGTDLGPDVPVREAVAGAEDTPVPELPGDYPGQKAYPPDRPSMHGRGPGPGMRARGDDDPADDAEYAAKLAEEIPYQRPGSPDTDRIGEWKARNEAEGTFAEPAGNQAAAEQAAAMAGGQRRTQADADKNDQARQEARTGTKEAGSKDPDQGTGAAEPGTGEAAAKPGTGPAGSDQGMAAQDKDAARDKARAGDRKPGAGGPQQPARDEAGKARRGDTGK